MADVPYRPFSEQTPNMAAMPLQRSGVDADTFGASTGRALQGLGDSIRRGTMDISGALMRHRDEQDANLATDANTAFMEKATQLYDGYAQKTGRDAYEAFPGYKKSLDDLWNESMGSLQSDGAKRQFQNHTRRFYVASLSDGQGYAGKQFKAWGKDSATGRADVLSSQAALNINNPAMMQQFLVSGGGEIRKAGEIDGLPPEMIESNVQAYWGKSIKNIVTLQSAEDPQAALATLQKYGPIMDPESRAQAAGMLRPLARDREATATVNAALGVPNATGARGSQAGGPSGYDNNIGNLRVSGADWIGKGSPYNGFETFSTPEQGAAAAYKNMQTIAERNGGDISLVDLITTWAPASDGNNPSEYAATVAKAVGMDIDDDVPLDDPEEMAGILKAMARVEKGAAFDKIPGDSYLLGVRSALEGEGLPNAAVAAAEPSSTVGGLPDKSSAVAAVLRATEGDADLQAAALSKLNSKYALQDAVTQSSRQDLAVQLPDVMRAAQMGDQTVTLPLDLMRKSGMTPEEFSSTVTQFDTSKRIGVMTQGLAFAPEGDLDAAEADAGNLSGPIGDAINSAAGGPAGTGNQAMRLALQSGAVAQIKKLKADRQQYLMGDNADPASYVAQAPGVVAARANLQQATAMASRTGDQGVAIAATRDYANAMLGQQAALGVPVEKRRVLTSDQAVKVGAALSPQPGQSGEMAVKAIRETAVAWGPAWPQVAGEIGANMSDVARVVAIMPQSQNFAAAKLVEFAGAQKDLETGSKGQIGTDIKEQAATAFKDFLGTFGSSGFKEGLQIAQAGELLTRGYTVLNGMEPGAAATLAYEQVVGSQYDVSSGMRVPKPFDSNLVVSGAETAAGQILDEGSTVALDPVMDDLGAGEDAQAQYRASLSANHGWVNSPDGKGLVLTDQLGRPVTSGGQPVFRSWQQLIAVAEPARRDTGGLPKESPMTPGAQPNLIDQKMQEDLQQLGAP